MTPVVLRQDAPGYPSSLRRHLGDDAPERITTLGNLDLLQRPSLALFCSRRCPGTIILKTYDLMKELRQREDLTIIGGFQSPMEREYLNLLLKGKVSVIVCPARAIDKLRISAERRTALEAGWLLYLSPFVEKPRRPTEQTAIYRNRCVAAVAGAAFVAFASPGGTLEVLCREVAGWGKQLYTHQNEWNGNLVAIGAREEARLRPEVVSS